MKEGDRSLENKLLRKAGTRYNGAGLFLLDIYIHLSIEEI
jgi:hypothetical protein